MTIKVGDFVIFKKGLYDDEEGAVYKVVEINGDRAVIEFVDSKMMIRLQSIAILSELNILDATLLEEENT